jgi:hypothetical protein
MKQPILILDLDGVLITTPSWKPDTIAADGYSDFNKNCVAQLNKLLRTYSFEIWLSSSRRKGQSKEFLNTVFASRGILTPITGFLPMHSDRKSRKEEVELFLQEKQLVNFLILDDDKSLNDLESSAKSRLVLTRYLKGFDEEKLLEALGCLRIDHL